MHIDEKDSFAFLYFDGRFQKNEGCQRNPRSNHEIVHKFEDFFLFQGQERTR